MLPDFVGHAVPDRDVERVLVTLRPTATAVTARPGNISIHTYGPVAAVGPGPPDKIRPGCESARGELVVGRLAPRWPHRSGAAGLNAAARWHRPRSDLIYEVEYWI